MQEERLLREGWKEGDRRRGRGGGVMGREGDCNTQAAGSAAGQ